MISQTLVELLACPACDSRPPVRLDADGTHLECTVCGRRYPVEDDIPVMLPEAAEPPVANAVTP
ncbi:MAG: Trm112 family protein [bacterium]